MVTTAEASVSVFSNFYEDKQSVSKLKGWGYSMGITFCFGLLLSTSYSVDIGSDGSAEVVDQDAGGWGYSITGAYWRVAVGYTSQLKKWKVKSIGKKKKKFKYKGIKVVAKKKKKHRIFYMNKKEKIIFKVKK